MLFVWKLRGFKVFQNLPKSVALYSDAPISDAPIFAHLVEHLEEHLNKLLNMSYIHRECIKVVFEYCIIFSCIKFWKQKKSIVSTKKTFDANFFRSFFDPNIFSAKL